MIAFPSLVGCNPDAVPDELRQWNHWVVWRAEPNAEPDKPPRKVLFDPKTGRQARTADAVGKRYNDTPADTWGTYAQARRAFDAGEWNGLGFVFTEDDPYIGGDIDHCRNPETGELSEEAQQVLTMIATYTEVSQSGTGIKFIGKGKKVGTACKRGDVEMYDKGRFFALTGEHIKGTPDTIEPRQSKFAELYTRWFPKKEPSPRSINLTGKAASTGEATDAELIEQIRRSVQGAKFDALWRGDVAGAGFREDESAADQSFCDIIVWWVYHDAQRVDRLFRQSGLMRPKWDEMRGAQTYGQKTIEKALQIKRRETPLERRANSSHQQRPPVPQENVAADEGESNPDAVQESLNKALAAYPLTDMGNGERLVRRHGTNLRYVHDWGKWIVWDGQRWQTDNNAAVIRLAKHTVRQIYAEAASIPVQAEDEKSKAKVDALAAHAKKSESKDRLFAMLKMAESEQTVSIVNGELDANHWLLNVQNGTLDLQTGKLHPHKRECLITKIAPIDFDPSARCPRWLAFLNRVLPDPELRAYVKRAAGYTLTGDISEQCIFFLYGNGKNGKSVFTSIVEALVGDLWEKTRAETLMAKRDAGGIPNDLACLVGKRLVTVTEMSDGQRLNEGQIKDMSGGDAISARFLHQEFFKFRPQFKLWLYGNHKPTIRGTDEGIWRRIKLIPFTVTIPEEERDKKLTEKLREELTGILAWAVEGCLEWRRNGLWDPLEVRQATQDYRAEMDNVAGFLSERCTNELDQFNGCGEYGGPLYDAYFQWCKTIGEHPCSLRAFGDTMLKKGYTKRRSNKGQYYQGIRLLTTSELKERADPQEPETEESAAETTKTAPKAPENADSCRVDAIVYSRVGSAEVFQHDALRDSENRDQPYTTIHTLHDFTVMIEAARQGKAYPRGVKVALTSYLGGDTDDFSFRVVMVANAHQRAVQSGNGAEVAEYADKLQQLYERWQALPRMEGGPS
jgi:putative DNA primase/helicase